MLCLPSHGTRWLAATTCLLAAHAHAQIAGVVVDANSSSPIEGALVSVQATTQRVSTAADGSFSLPGATGTGLVIVAAREGYYNASAVVDGGTSGVSLPLESVPMSNDSSYVFADAATCGSCHPDQEQQWRGSPMAQGGTNSWLYDIYDGTGTPGGMGGFVYTRDSVHAATNPDSECASCHQPEPWIERGQQGALEPIGQLSQGSLHGISCDVCHKIAHIDPSQTNYPGIWPGVVDFVRPAPTDGQLQFGVLGDTNFFLGPLMQPSYQPQLTSTVCAACHQDKNDPDEDGEFEEANGIISEPTYLEWLSTPYADPQSPLAASCVDCHMPSYGQTHVCILGGVPTRDPETIRHHRIEGTSAAYLENAVELKIRPGRRTLSEFEFQVDLTNSSVGHHVPTGVTVRNMILLVEAWRASDGAPLVYSGTQLVHALGGVGDPAQGYYAGLPGKLFAKHNLNANGQGPTFFTDATSILFDNRIPALATDSSTYRFQLPPGTGAVHVRARVIYRRAFRFLVDAKSWRTNGHGAPLEDVQGPNFGHLMEQKDRVFSLAPAGVVHK